MLQVSNLSKSYSDKTLFEEVSFTVDSKERIALIGRNGFGKSTIFKMLLGQEVPDDGEICVPKGYTFGSLAQKIEFSEDTVVAEAAKSMGDRAELEMYKAERMLSGLGFTEEMQKSNPHTLSGGYQLRVELAKALLLEPDMLLLDEPTNYLDIVSVRWLIKELRQWPKELMVISHDRGFLDQIATHTMIIHRAQVTKMSGGIDKLLGSIAESEEVYERTRLNEEKERKKTEDFIRRFRAQASKAALVQSRIKMLEKMDFKEALGDQKALSFSFKEEEFKGKHLLEGRKLSFGYDPDAVLFESLDFGLRPGDVIGVIGKNGKGKSTLLKLLAGELTALSGDIVLSSKAKIGHFAQTNVADLDMNATVEEEIWKVNGTLARTQVRDICGQMMFSGSSAEKKLGVLSGGEKSRVLLGQLLARPLNVLLLDEPTSHLDIESVDALAQAIKDFNGAIVLVTHHEEFLRKVATRLIVFQEQVSVVNGDYDYFLQKYGWEEEGGPDTSSSAESSGKSDYAERKARKNEEKRNKARAAKLERRFEELEKLIKKIDSEMVAVSEKGDYVKATSLSEERQRLEEEVDEVVFELDELI